jgi:hypothetical protein
MAMVTTLGTSVSMPANTPVGLTFDTATTSTQGTGVIHTGSSSFSVLRPGRYQLILTFAVQSSVANARGRIELSAGSFAQASPTVPAYAVKLLAANVANQNQWVYFLNVTTSGTFGFNIIMNAPSTFLANSTITSTASSSYLQIMEIA